MHKWLVNTLFPLLGMTLLALMGCQKSFGPGPYTINLVQPSGPHCDFDVRPATLTTLTDLNRLEGQLGRVAYLDRELFTDSNILKSGSGFETIDTQFSDDDGLLSALDYETLFAVSLYWSIERGHLLFSSLNPGTNLLERLPNMSETLIVHKARGVLSDAGIEETDNAAFFANFFQSASGLTILNYFFSFPTNTIETIPLGVNLGVMVHEYAHMVAFYSYRQAIVQRDGNYDQLSTETFNTLAVFDEGLADYFGFMATEDPAFLQCSLPTANRDLSVPKTLQPSQVQSLRTEESYKPHAVGAVLASVFYEIASQTDVQTVGQSLTATMLGLNQCMADQNPFTLSHFKTCHMSHRGNVPQEVLQNAYQRAFNGLY